MRDDQSPDVVKEAAQAQRQQIESYGTPLTPEQLALYQSKLRSAPVPVRWEILRMLGEASKIQAAARDTLAWWYPQETVTQLRVMIGTYLRHDELR